MKIYYPIDEEIELLRGFIQNIEKQIVYSINKYKNSGDHIFIDERGIYNYYEGVNGDDHDHDYIFPTYFPNLQRRSILIMLVSFLEVNLNQLCRMYKKEKNIKLDYLDLGGNGIGRAINYLEKVVELETIKDKDIWKFLLGIKNIRNIIVHYNGEIDTLDKAKKKEITNFVKKYSLYLNINNNNIEMNNEFLDFVLMEIWKLFDIMQPELV